MSLKNGCNNLYFHPYNLDERKKSFFYLTSLSCRGPVNPSTPIFGNVSLTETTTNLIVTCKFSQKWTQESLLALYLRLLFQMSLKNGCNSLYLHNKLFEITLKPNSYITSIFCHGLVYPSTLTFPNINLKKTVENIYVVSNVTEKSCNNLYLLVKVFHRSSKSNSYLMPVNL